MSPDVSLSCKRSLSLERVSVCWKNGGLPGRAACWHSLGQACRLDRTSSGAGLFLSAGSLRTWGLQHRDPRSLVWKGLALPGEFSSNPLTVSPQTPESFTRELLAPQLWLEERVCLCRESGEWGCTEAGAEPEEA